MQSVIVYRNPLEAAFWEGITSGQFFPIIVGIAIFFAVFLTVQIHIVKRFVGTMNKRTSMWTNVNLFASGVIGILVIRTMWI